MNKSKTQFSCVEESIEGLKIITPYYFEDERGYFLKNYEKNIFKQFGIDTSISEDFETLSYKNVIRGLHFQTMDPQSKLIRVIHGNILDVAVDLRKNSKTFGKWKAVQLSDQNHKIFWIPKGFAHGFAVLSDCATVSYKCIGKYLAEYDTGIRYDDNEIGVKWNIDSPIISIKDENLMSLSEFQSKFNGI